MEIRLTDFMRENMRFLLSENFRCRLFEKTISKVGSARLLAKKLHVCEDSISAMKNGKTKFLKWRIVKKLLKISETSREDLEVNVIAVKRGDAGKSTKTSFPIFPIKESPELSLLIAKSMGDGHLEKGTRRFSYKNKDERLINEVCKFVNKSIGITPYTKY